MTENEFEADQLFKEMDAESLAIHSYLGSGEAAKFARIIREL